MLSSLPADVSRSDRARRLVAFAGLSLGEILLTSFTFNFPTPLPQWSNPVTYAKNITQAGVLALILFLMIAWPQRHTIFKAWSEAARTHNWRASVLINIGMFIALLLASIGISDLAAEASEPPWQWFALYCCLLSATAASLAFVAAPLGFWRWLVRAAPAQIAVAIIGACLLVLAGKISLAGWSSLSGATLVVSHWILSLYEVDVVLDVERQLLGVGDFRVLILQECSGYEGIGLVIAFVAFYCWLMRRSLRFPNALVLFAVGIAAVWMLNALRIAALVSIGRHFSPEIALNGFHSQAGWIAFLAVAIGIMVASQRLEFLSARPSGACRPAEEGNDQLLVAFLVPFMALMATSIVASLFAPHDQWLYLLKVIAVGAALWRFRHVYSRLASAVSPLSITVGIAVGIVWAATDPGGEAGTSLGAWLAAQPAWLAAVWIACRALGGVVLVPMAEELAFRGYLQRALISRDFLSVAAGQFTWLSFLGASLLFGLTHERWVAAALAGAIYAVLLYRTNRLTDPIAAHMASNAVIVFWAIVARQWSLL